MISTLSPIILDIAVLAVGLIAILLEAFEEDKNKSIIRGFTTTAIGVLFVASFFFKPQSVEGASQIVQFYKADSLALFYKQLALGTTFLVLLMASEFRTILARYIPGVTPNSGIGEFFALPVFTCVGLMWMASAVDFIFVFVALELVTISFYILVSYMRRSNASLEAGVKYLILGALSTGFLVYGITWVFGVTGQTNFAAVKQHIASLPEGSHQALLFGMTFILIGLGFKIAAAPFQLWVPDVYQGAPTPITAYLSVGSKAAGFIVLMRVVEPFLANAVIASKLHGALWGLAILTLIYGNLAAMPQDNLKRLLAFSSIAHAGYLLIALASWSSQTAATVSFYLGGYLLMTMLAFLVMVIVNRATGGDDITDYNGLSQRSPLLAFGMLVAMMSLAGVPSTIGFFGKFLIFKEAVAQQQWALVAVGILAVGAGFYYYLKVVRAMYWNAAKEAEAIAVPTVTKIAIVALSVLIFVFGIFPGPVLALLK